MTNHIKSLLVLVTAVFAASCTVSDTPAPPLTGPSEMSLSLAISANPEVLSLDGSAQAVISIDARDANGQPVANVPLRLEIVRDGVAVDFGTLSTRTLTTGSNGRASFTYTVPTVVDDAVPQLEIAVTPIGSGNAASHFARFVAIRLIAHLLASFTFTPANPVALSDVRFDASSSMTAGGASIASYVWDFGDGSSGTNVTATHRYSAAGSYVVRLMISDTTGVSSQTQRTVVVGDAVGPTAAFVFSPSSPTLNQSIFFNATSSTAGPGHQIVTYSWNFGDGSTRTGSSVSKSYKTPGTYNVILTVTDEVGQQAQTIEPVTISASDTVAAFTYSPSEPVAGASVFFNGSTSTPSNGATISSSGYSWNWGDGEPNSTGATPSHIFANPGTYTVTLTVRDSAGQSDIETDEVTVAP